jgi:hypothetical protein
MRKDAASRELKKLKSDHETKIRRVSIFLPSQLEAIKIKRAPYVEILPNGTAHTKLTSDFKSGSTGGSSRDLFPDGKIEVVSGARKGVDFFQRIRLMWEGVVEEERKVESEIRKLRKKLEAEKSLIPNKPTKKARVELASKDKHSVPRKFGNPGEEAREAMNKDKETYDNIFNSTIEGVSMEIDGTSGSFSDIIDLT